MRTQQHIYPTTLSGSHATWKSTKLILKRLNCDLKIFWMSESGYLRTRYIFKSYLTDLVETIQYGYRANIRTIADHERLTSTFPWVNSLWIERFLRQTIVEYVSYSTVAMENRYENGNSVSIYSYENYKHFLQGTYSHI